MTPINSGHRDCINCGKDNAEVMFTFTREFLHKVRNQSLEELDAMGLDDDFTSSIVKCNECGCDYIRDVVNFREEFINLTNWSPKQIQNKLSSYQQQFSKSAVDNIFYAQSVIQNLMQLVLVRNQSKSELSLLDFGCSFSVYGPLARAMGFKKVDAFDPHYPDNASQLISSNSVVNFNFYTYREQLLENAPYDAIICNSADEHFFDLQGEIRFMRDLLSDDGVIYFSHPIMDLDANLKHLKNEANISNKKLLKILRATFHINHLNYIKPKMFKEMLRNNGLKESRVAMLKKRHLGIGIFHIKNIILYSKCLIKYLLGLVGANYRKTEFFLEKTDLRKF